MSILSSFRKKMAPGKPQEQQEEDEIQNLDNRSEHSHHSSHNHKQENEQLVGEGHKQTDHTILIHKERPPTPISHGARTAYEFTKADPLGNILINLFKKDMDLAANTGEYAINQDLEEMLICFITNVTWRKWIEPENRKLRQRS